MYLKYTKCVNATHVQSSDYRLVVLQGTMKVGGKGQVEVTAQPLGPGGSWFQPGGKSHADECLTVNRHRPLTRRWRPILIGAILHNSMISGVLIRKNSWSPNGRRIDVKLVNLGCWFTDRTPQPLEDLEPTLICNREQITIAVGDGNASRSHILPGDCAR
jgi:hypothetical protein